ncbi:PBSX family phage terminase large subunit [Fournierella sp.]|uniref:PBSX family phage terminase large subunit n=1 Tax=Allofournierella sp. TaxID=1940256 RepID=UPI0025C32698|nr:PBSX family phage terminase large subunit [Fournierella sp.]
MGKFEFRPFSVRQLKVLTWWRPESPVHHKDGIIADGSVRSGKSSIMSLSFVMWAMENFDGQAFGLCGKTVGSFRRNVLRPLRIMLRGRGYDMTERRGENLIAISKDGRENIFYIFGGKDEGSQDLIQGITLAGLFCDEVALMPESFVNQATARCSVAGSKWWFNCNPEGPEHWFFRNWIKKRESKNLIYLHFTMDDNPSLPEAIKDRYRMQYAGVFYERYILGRWCVSEGLVYDMVAKEPERFIMRGSTVGMMGRFFVSVDYGTKNPCSMGLWCVNDGTAVRIKESYYDSRKIQAQRTDEEHYEALCKLTQGYYVERVIVDPSAASFIETIRRHGKFMVRPAENDVLNGIRVVSALLVSGRLKIHESCTNARREFGMYRWDDKRKEDAVIKEYDHAMDDIRYFASTVLSREFRWVSWRMS